MGLMCVVDGRNVVHELFTELSSGTTRPNSALQTDYTGLRIYYLDTPPDTPTPFPSNKQRKLLISNSQFLDINKMATLKP